MQIAKRPEVKPHGPGKKMMPEPLVMLLSQSDAKIRTLIPGDLSRGALILKD
jgi:hypothetical protein